VFIAYLRLWFKDGIISAKLKIDTILPEQELWMPSW